MRDQGHIAGDQAPSDGIAKRAADHEMDFVDGLGRERCAAVVWVEQAVVERLEMMGTQSSKADATECRKDVPFDVAAIAVVGRGGEDQRACRATNEHVR